MGLFKDFKEDFSQAVGEMLPGVDEEEDEGSVDLVVDTLGEDVDVRSELSKLDGLLEDVDTKKDTKKAKKETKEQEEPDFASSFLSGSPITPVEQTLALNDESEQSLFFQNFSEQLSASTPEPEPTPAPAPAPTPAPAMPSLDAPQVSAISAFKHETPKTTAPTISDEEMKAMNETLVMDSAKSTPDFGAAVGVGEVVDETTVITESTTLTGDLSSAGSFDIQGTINGNVACNGKLSVTGTINGNSSASEFFADVAKIEGEVVSSGTVKIGAGSVIVGNISAASAVIAGAVKGDIDVQGPVVVDTSAVIMGNIKSRSVQINNGAVIEGFCSQCYADIDVQGLFDGK